MKSADSLDKVTLKNSDVKKFWVTKGIRFKPGVKLSIQVDSLAGNSFPVSLVILSPDDVPGHDLIMNSDTMLSESDLGITFIPVSVVLSQGAPEEYISKKLNERADVKLYVEKKLMEWVIEYNGKTYGGKVGRSRIERYLTG